MRARSLGVTIVCLAGLALHPVAASAQSVGGSGPLRNFVDMWLMRAAYHQVCGHAALSKRIADSAVAILTQVEGGAANAGPRVTAAVAYFVNFFNAAKTGQDATRRAAAASLFSADTCTRSRIVTRLEIGFIRARFNLN